MKTRIFLHIIIERFFGDGPAPKETPAGYVYFGPNTSGGFELIPWSTKIKGEEFKKQDEDSARPKSKKHKHYNIYVAISEVVSFALGPDSYISDSQKEDILNYVKEVGIPVIDYLNIKSQPQKPKKKKEVVGVMVEEDYSIKKTVLFRKSQKARKSRYIPKAEKPKEKFFEGKILQTVTLLLKEPVMISSYLGNEKIEIGPGEILLAEICSPLEHLDLEDRKKHTWGVLEKLLPNIFGRSVLNWHQVLGYNPFSVPFNDPPAQ
jgi:hypothetical protein